MFTCQLCLSEGTKPGDKAYLLIIGFLDRKVAYNVVEAV